MGDRPFSRAKPPVEFKCTACQQVFRRVEHLRRHLSTHVDTKPHICVFCASQFKRSDALRRHWKTCASRLASGNAVPQRSLSGKRKQSCDCCAERKRACDQGRPCSECQTRGSECTYHRVGASFPSQGIDGANKENPSSHNLLLDPKVTGHRQENDGGHIRAQTHESNEDIQPSHLRLDYLRNFTRALGINRAYNYKRSFMVDSTSNTTPDDIHPGCDDSIDFLEGPHWSHYLSGIESELFADLANPTENLENPLYRKASEVRDIILPYIPKGSNDVTLTTIEFFTPGNVCRYLDLFWDRWYPHCPIIHRPTFDINRCPAMLLMNMSLLGACTSSESHDREIARLLLDTAERVLFSHPIFSDDIDKPIDMATDETKVKILQATYYMCILQKWEGNDAAKRRIQRSKFTTFVAATRSLGLSRGTHGHIPLTGDFGVEEWQWYIRQEEMIRTFNFVFLLDSAFVIFHNSVPRMVLQEMAIDIPCPEEWFQASSAEEFTTLVNTHPTATCSPTLLSECVRHLCTETPEIDIVGYLGNASKLGLFTIATGIHGLIFHQKMSYTPLPFAKTLLSKALNRWSTAWQLALQRLGPPEPSLPLWKEDGFIGHADDFAALAQIHLERANTSQERWNELIKQLPGAAQKDTNGMATFDQTSMDQVANLIMAVELLNLDKRFSGSKT